LLALGSDPYLGPTAIQRIADLIEEDPTPRPCVEAMIREQGDALPEEIRHAFLEKVPRTPLLTPLPPRNRNYDKVPPTAFEQQLEEWNQLWRTGIGSAVDRYQARQKIAWDYWAGIKAS